MFDTSQGTGDFAMVDWRYDPGFKVPGTQYSKFFRLPGPYFAAQPDTEDPYDYFIIPETAMCIVTYYAGGYDRVKQVFEAVGKIPVVGDGDMLRWKRVCAYSIPYRFSTDITTHQAVGKYLAEKSGEKYDIFSITVSRTTEDVERKDP